MKKKWECWKKCEHNFKSQGFNRKAKALRDLYFRLKLQAKSAIRKYKWSQNKTGGGSIEVESPSDLFYAIMSISPEDCKKDESFFDSDNVQAHKKVSQNSGILEVSEVDNNPNCLVINMDFLELQQDPDPELELIHEIELQHIESEPTPKLASEIDDVDLNIEKKI
ncbi:hypothetical protein FQR65_LT02367 [Abscondita terminalis]|nr:hypothetical protein FQR65_LT02367 [Abscondita terminalis]